jgi:hypothetical protein
MSFANLKKSSSNLEKLTKAIESISQGSEASKDDNFWKPEVDKSGNGYAVIRFLPAPEVDGDDALPWVKIFSHGFQGPGGWLIDNCLTTVNDKCPVCEHNTTLWNSGIEANKGIARNQKRKLSYISNIYVVEDPKHPENNGKVFLYKFGKIIFDKITGAMNPEFEDETPVNPFDLWNGANFKLKIRKVDGYQNYDKCEFDRQSALSDNDNELEKIWKSEHSLKAVIEPSNFKSYDTLKQRLDKVLGLDGGAPAPRTTVEQAKAQPKPAVRVEDDGGAPPWNEEEDEALDYFKALAEEE